MKIITDNQSIEQQKVDSATVIAFFKKHFKFFVSKENEEQITEHTFEEFKETFQKGVISKDIIDMVQKIISTFKELPAKEKMTAVACVSYLFFPMDTIPDYTPIVGFLDDIYLLKLAWENIGVKVLELYKETKEEEKEEQLWANTFSQERKEEKEEQLTTEIFRQEIKEKKSNILLLNTFR